MWILPKSSVSCLTVPIGRSQPVTPTYIHTGTLLFLNTNVQPRVTTHLRVPKIKTGAERDLRRKGVRPHTEWYFKISYKRKHCIHATCIRCYKKAQRTKNEP